MELVLHNSSYCGCGLPGAESRDAGACNHVTSGRLQTAISWKIALNLVNVSECGSTRSQQPSDPLQVGVCVGVGHDFTIQFRVEPGGDGSSAHECHFHACMCVARVAACRRRRGAGLEILSSHAASPRQACLSAGCLCSRTCRGLRGRGAWAQP